MPTSSGAFSSQIAFSQASQSNRYPLPSYSSNNNGLTIDQHRNSIQQRIANLEMKILKKTSNQTADESKTENLTKQIKQRQKIFTNNYNQISSGNNRYDFSKQQSNYQSKNSNKYNYLHADQIANKQLRQRTYPQNNEIKQMLEEQKQKRLKKSKSPRNSTTVRNDKKSPRLSYGNKIKQSLIVSQNIKTSDQQRSSRIRNNQIKKQASNENQFVESRTLNLKSSTNRYVDFNHKTNRHVDFNDKINNNDYAIRNQKPYNPTQQFQNINKTISNLRNINPNIQKTTQPLNRQSTNNQLYQMMKSILNGQQKLEQQLKELKMRQKAKNAYAQQTKQFKRQIKQQKHTPRTTKQYQISQSRSRSANRVRNDQLSPIPSSNRLNIKPTSNRLDIKPIQSKVTHTDSNVNIRNKRSRAISASIVKNGLTAKNLIDKSFNQQLTQAKRQIKLCASKNDRIQISEQVNKNVWQKIQKVIKRSQKQNMKASNISHENNKFINDHINNTIELQKKLKRDLINKVYAMCQNKCLYK